MNLEMQIENAEKVLDVITDEKVKELERIKEEKRRKRKEKKRLKIIDETAISIRNDLKTQLTLQGKYGKHFDDMVEDYIRFFRLKEDLHNDINLNGLRIEIKTGNGYTTEKENKSIEHLIKTNGQMLKILQVLELKSPDTLPKNGGSVSSESGDIEHDLL